MSDSVRGHRETGYRAPSYFPAREITGLHAAARVYPPLIHPGEEIAKVINTLGNSQPDFELADMRSSPRGGRRQTVTGLRLGAVDLRCQVVATATAVLWSK